MNILDKLADPFTAGDIEWRLKTAGNRNGNLWAQVFAYISARAVQDRLDAICGPGGWRNLYQVWHEISGCKSQLCGICVLCGDEWVTKWDGAECSDREPIKGGLSNSFRRAAVQWGIGRYLYSLPTLWAKKCQWDRLDGGYQGKVDNKPFYWVPPDLPNWALPVAEPQKQKPPF